MAWANRMARELKMLEVDPPPGITAWPEEESLKHLTAQIDGPEGTVYEGGCFELCILVPTRYPFEPPEMKFKTKLYHPNIDEQGRICLDLLNLPPKGAWRPSLNLSTLLMSLRVLLGDPNPNDGLVAETTEEFLNDRNLFDRKARAWTKKYAMSSINLVGSTELEAGLAGSLGSSLRNCGENQRPDLDEGGACCTHDAAPDKNAKLQDLVDDKIGRQYNQDCRQLDDFDKRDQEREIGEQQKEPFGTMIAAPPCPETCIQDVKDQGTAMAVARPTRLSRLKRSAPQEDGTAGSAQAKCMK